MRFHGLRMVLGRRHGPRGMVRLQGLGNAQMNGVVAWGLGFNIATGRFKIEIETKTAALEGGEQLQDLRREAHQSSSWTAAGTI